MAAAPRLPRAPRPQLHPRRALLRHDGTQARLDPVRKISIIPRSQTLGVTVSAPESDRFSNDRTYLETRIKVATGGRAAEEIVFDEMLSGAESDIRQATELARLMVGRFGMSEKIGFVSVLPQEGDRWASDPGASAVSEYTRQEVDVEVKRIVDEALEETKRLLTENREKLDALAAVLMHEETLDGPEAYAAAGVEVPAAARADPHERAPTLVGASSDSTPRPPLTPVKGATP
ncbi:MAG TPA: hypothetical protein VMS63_07150 [Gaiellaceae bacterium]|nr:hypothetical protein [Gaiellaceae bacterium]